MRKMDGPGYLRPHFAIIKPVIPANIIPAKSPSANNKLYSVAEIFRSYELHGKITRSISFSSGTGAYGVEYL